MQLLLHSRAARRAAAAHACCAAPSCCLAHACCAAPAAHLVVVVAVAAPASGPCETPSPRTLPPHHPRCPLPSPLFPAEVLEALKACYDSLVKIGDVHIANSKLLDVIRQVRALHACWYVRACLRA